MNPKSEQTLVGLFVLIAGGLLLAAVFAIHGAFGRTAKTYHAYFRFAGGLEPGALVRFSGGPKVGRVENVAVDPKDSSHIDLTFSVQPDLMVKTDSKVKIMSMSPLGDNHLEILPGSAQAGPAPPGSLLPSEDYVDFNALMEQVNNIAPQAQQLLLTLEDRATELKVTLDHVNHVLSPTNQANLSATLAETRGMIADSRPRVRAALDHVNTLSEKLSPAIDDLRKTSAEANQVLAHIDATVGDTQPEVRQAVIELRGNLKSLNELTGRLNQTLDVNSENIDQLLDNLLHVTENLKEFTNTIKTRPYALIRASNPREHKTGEPQ
jgi:phospholipid/cholesterol/gamma-HCH transport system substrate-binding protein